MCVRVCVCASVWAHLYGCEGEVWVLRAQPEREQLGEVLARVGHCGGRESAPVVYGAQAHTYECVDGIVARHKPNL